MNQTKIDRGWIWYFVVLVVLATASVTIMIVYNLKQQLTLEKLTRAKSLWQQNGPQSYDMEYAKRGEPSEIFSVSVRDGKVVEVKLDGRPLEERLWHYHSMPALFGFIEDFFDSDAKSGQPRIFTVGDFDEFDGHLQHYVRGGASGRVEFNVTRFEPKAKTDPSKK